MPPTPSILSRASGKKFMKAIKKPFTKKESSSDSRPPEKKATNDSPQDQKDDIAATHKEERKIEDEEKGKTVERVEATTSVVNPKRRENPPPNANAPATSVLAQLDEEIETEAQVVGNYSVLFDHENNENMTTIRYGDRSVYTPNALSIFRSLHESYRLLNTNLKFQDKNVSFYSVATSLYYSVIYYIRILHVREILGENNYTESQFFRAFTRRYKLESLPVAGFLECEFANIGMYEPKDRRITFLYPQLESMFTFHRENKYYYDLNDASMIVQPNVPVLRDWMYIFSDPRVRLDDAHVSNGTFVPLGEPTANNAEFWIGGYNITTAAADHPTDATIRIIGSLGIDDLVPENTERLIMVRQEWTRSGFTTGQARPSTTDTNTETIADFLNMANNNFDWFQHVIDQAIIHAAQFNGITYLSNIPVRSSLETATFGNIHINNPIRPVGTANEVIVTTTAGQTPWFPRLRRNYQGSLTWYEPNYQDYHFWMARHSITNSRFTFTYTTHSGADIDKHDIDNIYGEAPGQANYYQRRTHTTQLRPARYGPYFGKTEDNEQMSHYVLGARGESRQNMSVLDRRYNYVRRFYTLDNKIVW